MDDAWWRVCPWHIAPPQRLPEVVPGCPFRLPFVGPCPWSVVVRVRRQSVSSPTSCGRRVARTSSKPPSLARGCRPGFAIVLLIMATAVAGVLLAACGKATSPSPSPVRPTLLPVAVAPAWKPNTWVPQNRLPTANELFAVDFVDATHGWEVGGGGVILSTADGGTTWKEQVSGTGANLTGVHFVDAGHGWRAATPASSCSPPTAAPRGRNRTRPSVSD